MLDIKFIRENPEKVKKAAENKQVEVDIDRLLELEEKKKEVLKEVEKLRAQRNTITELKQSSRD